MAALDASTYVDYIGSVAPYELHSTQTVARAVGIPARRLTGWVERGVIVPSAPASGSGTRTGFTPEDILRVAIVAEVQRLFGTNLRPGSIATTILADPFTVPWVDTVSRLTIRHDRRRQQSAEPNSEAKPRLVLYVYPDAKGRPSLGATSKPLDELLKARPVILVIDPLPLWSRIQSRLKD